MPTYRPRVWHLIAVLLIAVFDAGVLWIVTHPHVTDDYRNYYIDRSWSCFPRVITGYYPLGAPITFVPGRNGYARDTVRWCGFMPPSSTGIRSFGDYGILKLRFPVPDADLHLTFSSWGNTDSGKPERDVDVLVNGDKVGTVVFKDSPRVNGDFIIPATVAKKSDPTGMEIRFNVPRTGPPGTNSEPQTLQLRLEALRVSVVDSESKEAGLSSPLASPKRWR